MELPSKSMDTGEPKEENVDNNLLCESSEKDENKEQLEIEDLLVPAVEIPVDEDEEEGIQLDLSGQTEDKLFSCSVCNKSFTRRAHLTRHSRLHTNERPYSCLICNISFTRSEPRNQHMIKVHPEFRSESCNICGKAYIDENDRITHTRSHQIKRSFRCTVCPKEFEKASSLAGHMQVHSGNESSGRRVHRCCTCQMEFGRFDHLIRHQTVHSGIKLFQCKLCFKRFTRADNRKKHEHTCKGDSSASTAYENGSDLCDEDQNKTLNETDPLEIINVSSILEQDFEDIDTSSNAIDFFEDMKFFAENGNGDGNDDNDDSFTNGTKSSLSDSSRMSQLAADFDLEKLGGIRQKVPRPKLTQEEIDTLTCSICSKTLAQKYHLVRHKITHLGPFKPYKCLACGKTFSRREHLKPHLLKHRRESENLSKLKSNPKRVPHFKPFLTPPSSTVKPAVAKVQPNSLRSQLLQRFKVFAIKLKQQNPPDYYEQCFDFMGNLFLSNLQSINSETFSSKRGLPTTTILPKQLQIRKLEEVKPSPLLPKHSIQSTTQTISKIAKTHECSICNRTFTRAEHLRRHMAIHLNSTPYNCEICNRKFSRSDHMVQHFRVHHPDVRPYKCRYTNCFERFDTYKEKLDHGRNCNMFFTTPSTSRTTKTEPPSHQNGFDANNPPSLDDGGDPFYDANFAANNDASAVPNFQTHFIKTENECLDDGYDPIYGY